MTDEETSLAPIVARLGVVGAIRDDEQAVECVVLLKLTNFEAGGTSLGMYTSTGLDWIAQSGLIDAARQVMYSGVERRGDDE